MNLSKMEMLHIEKKLWVIVKVISNVVKNRLEKNI